ncbi:MAG: hypothetical protein EZS28_030614 [Streblomastix strix]|uniref:Ubiquitin-like domain-containing protein n=1 Tax=Streblomastix strix TaxID=222440 RepID=A0A5J4UTX2_9EUKA|nr:MAG: hypothetical protein EZS28_030614 [Streblomastix strix]
MCSICGQRIPSTLYNDHANEHAKAKELGQMQVFGKTITGKIIILDVEKSDTILELKKKIEAKIGVPYDQIRLQYKGKSLGDDLNQIQVYNIQNNETIYVFLRISVEDQMKL